ncbi:MAG: hypothetical protein ACTSVZ_09715 [Promethearchaeota archaeon]
MVMQTNVMGMASEHILGDNSIPSGELKPLLEHVLDAGYLNPLYDINPKTGNSFIFDYVDIISIIQTTNPVTGKISHKVLIDQDKFDALDTDQRFLKKLA